MTQVSADLDVLRGLLPLPPGIQSARWSIDRLGDAGTSLLPGPTDLRLIALLVPRADVGWDVILEHLVPAVGEQTMILPRGIAAALIDDLPRAGDECVELTGEAYRFSPTDFSRYRPTLALRLPEGLIVSAVTT